MLPLPSTGNASIDEMIQQRRLTPASNLGGVAALLAITPLEPSCAKDTAEVVSELRDDRS